VTTQVEAAPSASLIARSVGWMAAGQLVGQALWFGSLVVLAMLLAPDAFGVVAVGMAVLFFGNALVGMGTRAAIIAAPEVGAAELRAAVVLTCGAGVVVAGLVAAFASPIANAFAAGGDAGALRGMSLAVAFIAFAIVPLAVLDRRLWFKRSASARAGAALGASLAAIAAAVAGAGVWALVGRQVLYYGLVAALAWLLARDALDRSATAGGRRTLRRAGSRAFLVLACADFVALTVDTLIVGRLTDARQLGLYSLAFTLAFVPLTQLSWPVGQVLFPAAAATRDPVVLRRRTLVAVQTTAVVLLPLLPIAIAAAPSVIPDVLGERWRGMVQPFQILLVAGVGHAILNCIGESLSGAGAIGFRARVHAVWAPVTVASVAVLASLDGIRGAAIAHLALFLPLGAVYVIWGTRRIGLRSRDVWHSVRGVGAAVAAQALVTAGTFAALTWSGRDDVAGVLAAVVGAAVAAVLLGRGSPSPLGQTRLLIAAVRSGSTDA
jgi:O-antigen/teichoic acid export membrane protein